MSYGAIYPVTWWGSPIDGGFGDIYYDLVDNVITEYLEDLQNRATNYENEDNTTAILNSLDSCNLFDSATLVLTPTGYSEGVLHATKPPVSYGEEVVYNGDFSEAGVGNVVSQSGGVLVNDGNRLKITSNGSSGFSRGVWETNGNEGDKFIISADIVSATGSVRFIDISNNAGQSLIQGTTFETEVILGASSKQVGFGGLSDNSFELIIDNVSIREVKNADLTYTRTGTTTRVDSEGNTVSVAENVPVINYEGSDAYIRVEDGAVLEGGYEELFGSQEGSILIRTKNIADDGQRRQIYLIEEGSDDRIVFRYEPTSNQVETVIRDNGAGISTLNHIVSDTTTINNYFITWKNGSHKFYVNGTLVGSNTPTLTGIQGINKIKTDNLNSDIEVLSTYKTELTQDEITCINGKL